MAQRATNGDAFMIALRVDGVLHEFHRDPIRIGRGSDCEIVVDERGVALVQAHISPRSGLWVLTEDPTVPDSNLLNGRPVRRAYLKSGDQIALAGDKPVDVEIRPQRFWRPTVTRPSPDDFGLTVVCPEQHIAWFRDELVLCSMHYIGELPEVWRPLVPQTSEEELAVVKVIRALPDGPSLAQAVAAMLAIKGAPPDEPVAALAAQCTRGLHLDDIIGWDGVLYEGEATRDDATLDDLGEQFRLDFAGALKRAGAVPPQILGAFLDSVLTGWRDAESDWRAEQESLLLAL